MAEAHTHTISAGGRHRGRLYFVLALTSSFLVIEVIGGLWTGSLALLADAGHMLTDVLGLAMALLAIKLGERAASRQRTYGYYRAEILAALANAMLLILVAVYVLFEAYQRIKNPPEVRGGWMLVVAGVGLAVNLLGMYLLMSGAKESLNVKGAFLEVLGDTLGSVGVIVGAVIILLTGWELADPIIGVGIGLFIIPRAWNLLSETINILLEGVPRDVEIDEVRAALLALPGVGAVHDLHVWAITSGMPAVSAHLVLQNGAQQSAVLSAAQQLLHDRFEIRHTTLQLEAPAHQEAPELHR